MLYDETAVRDNIRNREGKRVFFLGEDDRLTPSARDLLQRERVEIRPAREAKIETYRLLGGGYTQEKPEHMTHLYGDVLVRKDHPRIRFRGAVDTLEAALLQAMLNTGISELEEILALARRLIRCEVMGEPVGEFTLCGLTARQQREHSHVPQKFYNQPHFMPEAGHGQKILSLNSCRCAARAAELQAVDAFVDADGNVTRADILQALNRMSSMLYILMIKERAKLVK